VAAVKPAALAVASDPEQMAHWLRHGGTWFAGVDVLPNDPAGAVPGGPPLAGHALVEASAVTGPLPLHPAQVSVTYPGYPQQDASESDTAFGYRLRRDAAHLDGLLPVGPERARHLREPHGYILGLPLTEASDGAAPLVVYEGSHEIMRAAFRAAFDGRDPACWGDLDVTQVYKAARRRCFDRCKRVEVTASPGEAILVHRLALHGIGPWAEGAEAEPEGRAIAYVRPILPRVADWLGLP